MADHDNPERGTRRHGTLKMAGYAAATAFCAVSVFANLRYGLSLGKNPVDKATYAVASVAADIFKIAVPLLGLSLWEKRRRSFTTIALMLWAGCVLWSMSSAVGFALSTRDEAIANRKAEVSTRHGWEATVERTEAKLVTLGNHRPINVMTSTIVEQRIWRRSRQCSDLALEESRVACAPVVRLRRELAAAEAAERLESQLVMGRTQLATVAVAGTVSDPHAGALARLTGFDEATIRAGVALLLAALIEAGSALGFTIVSVSTTTNPPLSVHSRVPGRKKATDRLPSPTRRSTVGGFGRWVQARLKADPVSKIAAREAYADFCEWSRAAGLDPCTETRFGRELTALIGELGGQKAKRRDRTYYVGVSLQMRVIADTSKGVSSGREVPKPVQRHNGVGIEPP